MKFNFRQEARNSLDRAKVELNSQDNDRLKYAALELRMAIEAITYDRARAYKDEIPPEEYRTWQPKKIMQLLIDINPRADQNSTLKIKNETSSDHPNGNMHSLGTDIVLNLKTIKSHYDALSSYLHMPTINQLEKIPIRDTEKLRKKCEGIVKILEKVLSASLWNVTLGNFSSINCTRCNQKIRKRIPLEPNAFNETKAKCFNCGAEYIVTDAGPNETNWEAIHEKVDCPSKNCTGKFIIWHDEIKEGTKLNCSKCGKVSRIGFAVFEQDPPESN